MIKRKTRYTMELFEGVWPIFGPKVCDRVDGRPEGILVYPPIPGLKENWGCLFVDLSKEEQTKLIEAAQRATRTRVASILGEIKVVDGKSLISDGRELEEWWLLNTALKMANVGSEEDYDYAGDASKSVVHCTWEYSDVLYKTLADYMELTKDVHREFGAS